MPAHQLQDLFVGMVALGLGVYFLTSALGNNDWFFRLRKAEYLDVRWGRRAARRFYLGLGVTLILLGLATAGGCFRSVRRPLYRDLQHWLPTPLQAR